MKLNQILLSLLFSFFFFSVSVFASEDIWSYQRLANLSASEEQWFTYTKGDPANDFKHLVYIENQATVSQNFTVRIILPHYLELSEQAVLKWMETGTESFWQDSSITDLGTFSVILDPGKHIFLKYFSNIKESLPNENLELVVFMEVTSEQGETINSANRILVPYYQPSQPIVIEEIVEEGSNNSNSGSSGSFKTQPKELTTEQEEEIKEKYEEEKELMEEQFLKLMGQKTEVVEEEQLLTENDGFNNPIEKVGEENIEANNNQLEWDPIETVNNIDSNIEGQATNVVATEIEATDKDEDESTTTSNNLEVKPTVQEEKDDNSELSDWAVKNNQQETDIKEESNFFWVSVFLLVILIGIIFFQKSLKRKE